MVFFSAIIVISLFIDSCKKHKSELHAGERLVKNINLDEGIGNSVKMNLSVIADSIEYLRLKTKGKAILGDIREIEITNKYMVVSDQQKNIFLFDRQGEYLKRIGSYGRGPLEYQDISSFHVSDNIERIFLFDGASMKILAYDLVSGKCLKSNKIDFFPEGFMIFRDTMLVFLCSAAHFRYTGHNYHIYVMNGNLELTDSLMQRHYSSGFQKSLNISFSEIYRRGKYLYFWESNMDTVFRMDEEKIIVPYMTFTYDKYLKRHNPENSGGNKFIVNGFIETNRYIFINGIFSGKYGRNILFDKKTRDNRNIYFNYEIWDRGFHNDLDGGIPFWPSGTTTSGRLYCTMYLSRVKRILNHDYCRSIPVRFPQKRKDMYRFVDQQNLSDEPLIFIVTLKKEKKIDTIKSIKVVS